MSAGSMSDQAICSYPSESTPVTVCIVTFRRDKKLIESLSQLLKSTVQPVQVLIVDNGASADLPRLLAGIPLPIEIIYPEGNVGCAGLNLAFAKSVGHVVVCLDDDSYPAPDCMESAVRVFAEDSSMGMIGFKMHVPETGEPWHDELWNPDIEAAHENVYCSGCGLAFRRDPRLPKELCLESIVSQQHELSMAAEFLRLGYKIEFRPECKAYHPRTGGKEFPGDKFEMVKRNQMRFLGTYLPLSCRSIVVASYLLFIFAHRLWGARVHLASFLSARRRPLSRGQAASFSETAQAHTHPLLKKLMARSLGIKPRA